MTLVKIINSTANMFSIRLNFDFLCSGEVSKLPPKTTPFCFIAELYMERMGSTASVTSSRERKVYCAYQFLWLQWRTWFPLVILIYIHSIVKYNISLLKEDLIFYLRMTQKQMGCSRNKHIPIGVSQAFYALSRYGNRKFQCYRSVIKSHNHC